MENIRNTALVRGIKVPNCVENVIYATFLSINEMLLRLFGASPILKRVTAASFRTIVLKIVCTCISKRNAKGLQDDSVHLHGEFNSICTPVKSDKCMHRQDTPIEHNVLNENSWS